MDMKVAGLFGLAVLSTALLFQINMADVEDGPRLVFPGLKEQLSGLTSIKVTNPNGNSASIVKQHDSWVLEEKSGYNVDFSRLSRFLVNFSELRIVEEKTSISSNHSRLGVAVNEPGAATSVIISPGEYSLLVGNEAPSQGSFVRYADDAQVYLTNKPVAASADWIAWVDPVVINIAPANVREVTIATRSAQLLLANRAEASGEFELLGIPTGRELKHATVADSLTRLLVNVRMLDVEPYNPVIFNDPSNTRLVLLTGETIIVRSIILGDRFMMHIDRKNLADWQFEISELTYSELNKNMESMLKAMEADVE
ncbi:MAG: DUF4340 domain-containing protein [Pseudomonadales bacterium]|nr:DUF4340 domain-containing protein [Pseudomonadales bacterium]